MTVVFDELLVVVGAIIAIVVALYMFHRFMQRKTGEFARHEPRRQLDDRSFNQIQLARVAADSVAREGVDVSRPRALLADADKARATGDFARASELATSAADQLASLRGAGARVAPLPTSPASASSVRPASPVAPTAAAAPPTPLSSAPGGGAAFVEDPSSADLAAPDRPPKNKMEARFEIGLASGELDQARAAQRNDAGLREAESQRAEAQAAFDRGDFTSALRWALKSRRSLGARVESLPTSPAAAADAPGRDHPATPSAETVGFGGKCPQCGRVAASGDQFCRACGAAIPTSACPSCGAPLLSGDRFCAKCGAGAS